MTGKTYNSTSAGYDHTMNTPTIRQLQYFLALADTLSFHKAAEACFVTQPALSEGIKSLEDLLGTTLCERSKRSVTLTE
ncbi:MAG TPA: LysR family transcriptional regulator, partial [Micavibrio sp.]